MPEPLKPLSEILAYRNPDVISKFRDKCELSSEDAAEVFDETKKWLWLCAKAPNAINMTIQDSIIIIDDMWHTFILFTKEYQEFCSTYFGQFIHHVPIPKARIETMRQEAARTPDAFIARRGHTLRALYGFIHDELGRDTLIKWYEDFPRRFGNRITGQMAVGDHLVIARPPLPNAEALPRADLIEAIVARHSRYAYCSQSCGAFCTCRTTCQNG